MNDLRINKNKPLNCLYCVNASLEPGSSRTATFESIPLQPVCQCMDVPHELVDLYLLQMLKNNNAGFSDVFNWLPYHCGHFAPRLVRMHCYICGKRGVFSEWHVVENIYTGDKNIMACSTPCMNEVNRRNKAGQV